LVVLVFSCFSSSLKRMCQDGYDSEFNGNFSSYRWKRVDTIFICFSRNFFGVLRNHHTPKRCRILVSSLTFLSLPFSQWPPSRTSGLSPSFASPSAHFPSPAFPFPGLIVIQLDDRSGGSV
jgi:hypothetical protein